MISNNQKMTIAAQIYYVFVNLFFPPLFLYAGDGLTDSLRGLSSNEVISFICLCLLAVIWSCDSSKNQKYHYFGLCKQGWKIVKLALEINEHGITPPLSFSVLALLCVHMSLSSLYLMICTCQIAAQSSYHNPYAFLPFCDILQFLHEILYRGIISHCYPSRPGSGIFLLDILWTLILMC
jgi:hypothetical protein